VSQEHGSGPESSHFLGSAATKSRRPLGELTRWSMTHSVQPRRK
jgi:hypothetical protein